MDLAVTERHRLLGSLLDYNAKGPVSDLVPSFTSYFSRVLPERFEGELAMRVQQFFDPSYQYPLQRCFELAAFFVSNNKPTKEKIKDFLKWVIDNKYTPQLESFLRLDTSTTRAFSQRILEAAFSMKNTDLLRSLLLSEADFKQRILEAAVSMKNTNLLRSLLLSGADFKPVILEAIQTTDSDFIELLLSRVDPECLSGDSGGRLLLYICGTDNVRAASILVENGANINFNSYSYSRGDRTGTPLYNAVSNKQPKMVRFLLDKGADVNARCSSSYTPTALAVGVGWNHNIEIVTLLLEHGADLRCSVYEQDLLDYVSLNCKDVYRLIREKRGANKTFVTVADILDAASKGSGSLSDYLSRHKDNVSQEQLENALYESINQNGYGMKTTVALLDWGVDPNTPTLDEPPLLLAAICDKEKAISATQLLLDAGADVNVPDLLCRVIEEESFELLCELLDAGIDLDQFGPEALEKAVLDKQVETVALLTDRGTPVNAIGARFSPLQAAASCDTLDLAEYLIDRGADINTPAFGYEGRTALQYACCSGNLGMVEFLLANKADVNAPPAASKGMTALEGVLSCGATAAVKEELFQLLLDNGAKVTLSNERLCNGIIHTIVKKGLTNLLEIALKAGANVNSMSRGNEGRTPLQLAAELGQLDIVKTLVEHGAKINAAPAYKYGRTTLQAAATLSSPNMELLNYLVDNGAEVNAPAGICGGITAMQGAAIAGNIPVVQYLLGKEALVNGKPAMKEGRTAIEGAAEHGRLDTVQLLLNYGATGSVGVEEGFKKAIKLAKENRHTEIVKMLRSAQSATESELV
jgi:ankyrin repeat protein